MSGASTSAVTVSRDSVRGSERPRRGAALERPLTKQVTVESTHRGHPARDARGPEAAPPEPCQIRDEIVGRETCEGAAVAAEELGKVGEVAAVGGEGISRRPLLRLQGAEIPNDDLGHRVTTSNLITAPTNRETAGRAGSVLSHSPRARSRAGAAPGLGARQHPEERGALRKIEDHAGRPEEADGSCDRSPEPQDVHQE